MPRSRDKESLSNHAYVKMDISMKQLQLSKDHASKKPCSHIPIRKSVSGSGRIQQVTTGVQMSSHPSNDSLTEENLSV